MLSTLVSFQTWAEAFALKASETATHLRDHPVNDLSAKGPLRPCLIALYANVDTGIEDNGDGQGVPLASQCDPAFAIRRADIGCVDNGQLPVLQPLASDLAYQIECIAGDALIGFTIGNESAAIIG